MTPGARPLTAAVAYDDAAVGGSLVSDAIPGPPVRASRGAVSDEAVSLAATVLPSPALPGDVIEPLRDAVPALRAGTRAFRRAAEVVRSRLVERALSALPLTLSLLLITSLAWGPLLLPLPVAILLLGFDLYWAWRSFNTGVHVVKGQRAVRHAERTDWRATYDAAVAAGVPALRWEDVRHVVIIPNYKEKVEKLRATLQRLAECDGAREQIIPVLAMELAEPGCAEKAASLIAEFGDRFFAMFATYHPDNLEGEVRGKSSNEAWAARRVETLLTENLGIDLRNVTVTSCDADTLFHRRYFAALTCLFATHPKRYRRFWQAPILLYNNIWEVPAPLRLPNGLGSLNHVARLARKHRIIFPQSCYSLSFLMAKEVGYWDVDVIPEDWHMYLKCFFELGGDVEVEPIHLPVGNDGVRTESYFRTFIEQYRQARRHAWGATDVPYAILQLFRHPEIPLLKRVRRTWTVLETHVLWASQWWLITVGRFIPFVVAGIFGVGWWPHWFDDLSVRILFPCMGPLIVMVVYDSFVMRPPRPPSFPLWMYPVQFAQWFAMAPVTFFFTALPALDAQVRLAIGKRLEYKVTEKA